MMKVAITAGALLLAGLPHLTAAADSTNIFVAGYDGFVRTVQFTCGGGAHKLIQVNQTDGCKNNPSWLSIQHDQRRLWCLDEGFVGNGTLNRFDIEDGGALTQLQRINLTAGPVHSKFYNGGKNIAIAQFGGADATGISGGITTGDLGSDGLIKAVSFETFGAQTPGPRPGQNVSRAHGVYPDPRDKNLVALNYGGDQVRTYSTDGSGKLSPGSVVQMIAGTGPRHAAFYAHNDTSQLYLLVVSEFANTITTFNVSYDANDVLSLSNASRVINTFGGKDDSALLAKAKAAEIRISPDNQFVVVSNRNDTSFPASDSLATYRVNADGSLAFVQLAPAGGLFPRAFQFNKAGDKVLVSAQTDSKIVVLDRNVQTGMIGNVLASLPINTTVDGVPAGIPAAIWDE